VERSRGGELEWGRPAGGARIRARALKETWKAGETPTLHVDLTTGKSGLVLRNFPHCEVEVDGVWYVPRITGIVAGARVVPGGSLEQRIAAVRLEPKLWLLKSDPDTRLQLTPGRHAVRVACDVDEFRPVSQSVSIEVAAPD
jgi:hypothetical protein